MVINIFESFEKDRNYIISVFSAVVAFAALVVAVVGYAKGMM